MEARRVGGDRSPRGGALWPHVIILNWQDGRDCAGARRMRLLFRRDQRKASPSQRQDFGFSKYFPDSFEFSTICIKNSV